MFLSLVIVPWVTANSDTRGWYTFSIIVTYPDRDDVDVAGWVTGVVVCAVIAAVLLVLVASQARVLASAARITAVVGAVLITALGFAVAHAFTAGDEDLHMSAGPWLFALGTVLVSVALLKPSIGARRSTGL